MTIFWVILSLLLIITLMYLGGYWKVYEKVNKIFTYIKNIFKPKGQL